MAEVVTQEDLVGVASGVPASQAGGHPNLQTLPARRDVEDWLDCHLINIPQQPDMLKPIPPRADAMPMAISIPRTMQVGVPGGYAHRHYKQLRRQWRRRVMPRITLVCWIVIGLGLAGIALPGKWPWVAGMCAGAGYAMWLLVRDQVPRHIEKWLEGAEGERKTAKVLKPLEKQGWTVAHDLQGEYGNVDHLLVGPGGVFLLDSKQWAGDIVVAPDGVVTVTPRDHPEDAWSSPRLARSMKAASAGNKEAWEHLTGIRTWVQPLVVFWGSFDQGVVEAAGVVYLHGDRLAEWLGGQRARLSPASRAKLASLLGS